MDSKDRNRNLLDTSRDILQGFRALVLTRQHAADSHAPEQRRRLTRLQCLYRVACLADGEELRGTVVDMGLVGLRLEVPRRVAPGSLLPIRLLMTSTAGPERRFSVDTVNTRVLWCRKKRLFRTIEIGAVYEDEDERMERSWIKFILRQLGFDMQSILDRRKTVRVQALLHGDLKAAAEDAVSCLEGTVINLGAGGALFEGEGYVPRGSTVVIELGPYDTHDRLTCRGTVVQCVRAADSDRWLLGIRFEDLRHRQVALLGEYIHTLLQETIAQ